ncbi:MAG: DEAD/DEAH box helicase, partial [Clostridia bacterium]|nr:DEAD/DEAH box helicase [Clostridia bacterium]
SPPDEDGRTHGTLSYNKKRKTWVVRGDPNVTELCKRIFPGSEGGRRGSAVFAAHRRLIGELNWLMLRYPLEIKPQDRPLWEKAIQEARAYAIRRELAALAPQKSDPPEGTFNGCLMEFQREGLAFLINQERCLLADEMGLGKTVQALAFLAAEGAFPALIIPPAHLISNWRGEIIRFLTIQGREPRVHIIKGLKPYPLPEADIYLMHYLLLRGWKQAFSRLQFAAVIFDEAQELRHAGTEKYSAASLLAGNCRRVVGLSGTPIYNTGGEIWNVINILDFHFLGSWDSFSREWCYGYGQSIVIKPELLGAYLKREGMMLRRVKEDVMTELPPKRRLVTAIDSDDSLYQRLAASFTDTLRTLRDAALPPSERAILENIVSQEDRQATGIAKAPFVCQFVRALVEGGEKVLLFAHHHKVMDAYKSGLKSLSPGFITGRENTAQKDLAVQRFMEGRTNLLCLSLRSASGLNLQRAGCVVFGELDWSPAVHAQAEDRAHRIGQADSLLCYYLVSPSGCDADMQEALGLKVSQFVGLMGDKQVPLPVMAQNALYARRHAEKLLERLTAAEANIAIVNDN